MKEFVFYAWVVICLIALFVLVGIGCKKSASRKAKIIAFIGSVLCIAGAFASLFLMYPPKAQPIPETDQSTTKEQLVTGQTVPLAEQFLEQGFSPDEAKLLEEHFCTMGIKSISNLTPVAGNGIDNLQSFQCTIYDYSTITFNFTIENRKLCYAELAGIPTEKADYAYVNIFGNVKIKTKNTTKSVTFYDVWDSEGEVIEDAVGYKAVFDYESKKINEYKVG